MSILDTKNLDRRQHFEYSNYVPTAFIDSIKCREASGRMGIFDTDCLY